MAVKERIKHYEVVVRFTPESQLYAHEAERQARQAADLVRAHLGQEARFGPISVGKIIDRVCEHCGDNWGEKSTTYNGGCCDEDEAANPAEGDTQ